MTFNVSIMVSEQMRIKSGSWDQKIYIPIQPSGCQADTQDCSQCSYGCFRITDNVLLARSSASWDICHPAFLSTSPFCWKTWLLTENISHQSRGEECNPSSIHSRISRAFLEMFCNILLCRSAAVFLFLSVTQPFSTSTQQTPVTR